MDDAGDAAGRGELHKGDPRVRRLALMIVGAGALAGAVLITLAGELRPAFDDWVRRDLDTRVRIVMAAMVILTSGPLLGLAWYLWRLGREIVQAGRYPPPGMRVMHDTPVVSGNAAARRGRLLQAAAAMLGAGAVVLAALIWRLLSLLTPAAR
jgi:hypothetical protein